MTDEDERRRKQGAAVELPHQLVSLGLPDEGGLLRNRAECVAGKVKYKTNVEVGTSLKLERQLDSMGTSSHVNEDSLNSVALDRQPLTFEIYSEWTCQCSQN